MSDSPSVLVLSSSYTGISRWIFAPYLLFALPYLVLGLAQRSGPMLLIAGAMGFGAALRYMSSRRLLDISIAGDVVTASSYRRTTRFALSTVSDIQLLPRNRACMHVRELTPFGYDLLFQPRGATRRGENAGVQEARARMLSAQ
ncbi:MAG: hypothetical protein ABI639_02470 [Thermoanaerobaculia bacterium]